MQYRRCGTSGCLFPALSLGGWHNFSSLDQARDLVLCAFEHGITHMDLANNYGPPVGMAEVQFGRIMETDLAGHRDELIISTKAGFYMWDGPYGEGGSRKHVLASLDQSLRRLGMDYVDIFYSHRYDKETPLEETMGALHQAVRCGKALYAGISNYPEKATRKAAKIMDALGTPLLIHQCAYNLLNRSVESGVMEQTQRRGMGLAVFSPLAQGLLTDRYLNGIPEDSRIKTSGVFLKKDDLTESRLQKIGALNDLASERGQSLARLALQWCLRRREIATVIIGASRSAQILENIEVLEDSPLTEEFCLRLDAIIED